MKPTNRAARNQVHFSQLLSYPPVSEDDSRLLDNFISMFPKLTPLLQSTSNMPCNLRYLEYDSYFTYFHSSHFYWKNSYSMIFFYIPLNICIEFIHRYAFIIFMNCIDFQFLLLILYSILYDRIIFINNFIKAEKFNINFQKCYEFFNIKFKILKYVK